MSKQSLDEILFGEEDESPQPQTAATPLEDVAAEEYTPPPSTSITVIETHGQPTDIIAWMSHQADAMPDLASYDLSKAVSYDMAKISWMENLGKPFLLHLFAIESVKKPDMQTGVLKDMDTVILRNQEKKVIHDSKAILVDKCRDILALRPAPVPVVIKYLGKKKTASGFQADDFEVKVLV